MTVDYRQLIDDETWKFIARTNDYYPPDTVDYTIDQQREIYDRMCREFFTSYPQGVIVSTEAISLADRDIPIRIYRLGNQEPAATILYYHGGGFILGGLESHDDVCAELCAGTGYEVISVDYRLAPEHLHPAAHEDAFAAFEFAAERSQRPILLCGDSAGGNLAAATANAKRHHRRHAIGQVLIYPGLGGDQSKGSYLTHSNAPMLTTRDLDFYADVRTGGADISTDYAYAPLRDPDFADLPPSVLISAECDPLSSDGEAYCKCLREAGGKAVWFEEKGLVHGYLRARHSVSRARKSFERIVTALSALGQRHWPYGE